MAKKHFLIPAKLVNRLPALRKFIWFVEAAVLKATFGLLRMMPLNRAYRFIDRLFRVLKPLLPFTTKIHRNLSIAFPHKNEAEIEQLTRAICGNIGKATADLALANRLWEARDDWLEFEIEAGMDMADYQQRPAVFFSAHLGGWQIISFITAQYGLDITTLYAPDANPYLKDYLLELRSATPMRFISRDGCMRHLTQALKQGKHVGLIVDTRFEGGELVDFFGVPTEANTTAARLALRHNCDLVPILAERLDDLRLNITVCKPVKPADPNAPMAAQARQMTQSMYNYFEKWIKARPEQWMCFSRRWPKNVFEK